MEPRDRRERQSQANRPRPHASVRLGLVMAAAVLVAALAAGIAFAKSRTSPIGTGVVVIDTALGYEGGSAAGTGMVLSSSGEILTNNHVIRSATRVRVVVPGTGHSYAAKVVGYDVTADVAVLQATGASNLATVSIGDSSALKVGEAVRAVGNAGGGGTLVSATGTVTALERAITVSEDDGETARLTGLVETNASLEPGDSGGPLLVSGKVVGMDTAASTGSGYQQVASSDGFAIPIARAVAVVKLIEAGEASTTVHIGGTAFLGVSIDPNADTPVAGAAIAAVVPGGAAATAGLVEGDVITAVDGHAISTATALSKAILAKKPGSTVTITYLDGSGTKASTSAKLGSGPPQ